MYWVQIYRKRYKIRLRKNKNYNFKAFNFIIYFTGFKN